MTKEELKQEAEEKAGIYFDSLDYDRGNVSDTPFYAHDVFTAYEKGAMDFAEPREKQIQTDAEQIRALQKQNGELTDRVKELEAQIEQMKCCPNCKHFNYEEVGTGNKDCILWQVHKVFCENKNMWKLRR